MRTILGCAALAVTGMVGSLWVLPSQAQMGAGPGQGAGPGAQASAPGGAGMRAGRYGEGVTPGWMMMTPEERDAHRAAMQGMATYGDCRAYVDKHRADMMERARQRGATVPAQPRQDPCSGLPK